MTPPRLWAAIVFAGLPLVAKAGVIHVDAAAPAGGNGASWNLAYRTLQAALAVAGPGDEVRVARGTYRPGPPGSARTLTFAIPSGVAVRGGFAGITGVDPDARNITAFPTILSGDFAENDDASFGNYDENAFHVVTIASGNSSTVLDGCSVRAGYGGGVGGAGPGAGVLVTGGAPRIIDCTVTANDNPGDNGGGVAAINSIGQFIRCAFVGNRCQSDGGGLYMSGSGPEFDDCLFDSNIGGNGAGAYNTTGGDPVLRRCTFRNNRGEISIGEGAGYFDNQSTTTFWNCLFQRNTNNSGGAGLYCFASPLTQAYNCAFIGNSANFDGGGAFYTIGALGHTVLKGCLFIGNRTQATGNVAFVGSGALADFINCTIVNNGLGSGTGAISTNAVATRLFGSIMWNNPDRWGAAQAAQFVGGAPSVNFSCIQGWTGSLGGAGNTGADPKLANPSGPDNIPGNDDDNLRLTPGSPCIDAAINSWLAGLTTDLDGNPRLRDDLGTPDTGTGAAPIADMGAYEFQGISCYANCDQSSVPPFLTANDFQCFLNAFGSGAGSANCDSSTTNPILTANDFQCFLNAFAAGCS